jgi:hypothetical protein
LFGRTGSVQGDWDETSVASVVPGGIECPGRGLGAVFDDTLDVAFDSVVVFDALDVVVLDPLVR